MERRNSESLWKLGKKQERSINNMAKAVNQYAPSSNTKRPGVHSKSKTSNHKASRKYKKSYRGQGR